MPSKYIRVSGSLYVRAEEKKKGMTGRVLDYLLADLAQVHDFMEEAAEGSIRWPEYAKLVYTKELLRELPEAAASTNDERAKKHTVPMLQAALTEQLKYVNWDWVAKKAKEAAEVDYGKVGE